MQRQQQISKCFGMNNSLKNHFNIKFILVILWVYEDEIKKRNSRKVAKINLKRV